jgi:hypothetical protein
LSSSAFPHCENQKKHEKVQLLTPQLVAAMLRPHYVGCQDSIFYAPLAWYFVTDAKTPKASKHNMLWNASESCPPQKISFHRI